MSKPKSRRAWADRINGRYRKSGDQDVAVGDDLIQAKKELGHGEFGKMIRNDLEFSHNKAHRLMRVAGNPGLRNCAHAHKLPAAWTTKYELTRLSPEAFEAAIKSGKIHPGMERSDAKDLVAQHKPTKGPVIGTPDCYKPPPEDCFCTSTTVWDVADMKTVSCDWDRVFRENGVTGPRAGAARPKSTYGYSGTYSRIDGVIPEWALLRWAGPNCTRVLDPFAGEAITAVVAMRMSYD